MAESATRDDTGPDATSPRPADGVSAKQLALVVVIAILVGTALGLWQTRTDDDGAPAADSVDVGFAQDMSVHHGQAVEMSAIALTNAADPAVRNLAYDVVTTQQNQIGTMQGWLTLWNQPTLSPGDYMTWMPARGDSAPMRHPMPDTATDSSTTSEQSSAAGMATMPGMATTEEIGALRRTTGPEFDILYLQLLVRHHQGGIPMSRYAEANSSQPAVRLLAGQIAATQEAESVTMRTMLAAKGAQPLPMN